MYPKKTCQLLLIPLSKSLALIILLKFHLPAALSKMKKYLHSRPCSKLLQQCWPKDGIKPPFCQTNPPCLSLGHSGVQQHSNTIGQVMIASHMSSDNNPWLFPADQAKVHVLVNWELMVNDSFENQEWQKSQGPCKDLTSAPLLVLIRGRASNRIRRPKEMPFQK